MSLDWDLGIFSVLAWAGVWASQLWGWENTHGLGREKKSILPVHMDIHFNSLCSLPLIWCRQDKSLLDTGTLCFVHGTLPSIV